MTGLSCSPTRRDAEDLRLERLPGAREERVVRAGALGQRPAPGRQRRRAGASRGPSPCRVAVRARPTKTEKPSAATGAKACLPTSRCQRATSPRCVRPMLPVPEPADRDAGPRRRRRSSAGRRAGGRRRGTGSAHRPRRQATLRDRRRVAMAPVDRSLLDPGDDDAAHERPLGEEEHDDRHGHRHQRGGLDQRRLGRVQRVVLLDRRPTAAGAPACPPRYSSGRKKSFQAKKKWNRLTAMIAGTDSGRMTERRIRNGLAPSIIAASSRSRGIDMKYWRSRKTL